jgi:hypothetical protein
VGRRDGHHWTGQSAQNGRTCLRGAQVTLHCRHTDSVLIAPFTPPTPPQGLASPTQSTVLVGKKAGACVEAKVSLETLSYFLLLSLMSQGTEHDLSSTNQSHSRDLAAEWGPTTVGSLHRPCSQL